jgi:MFS family permease
MTSSTAYLCVLTNCSKYDLTGKPTVVLADLSSNIVSVIQAGAFLGCLFSMWLANKIGRRMSLVTASLFVFVGVALQAGASGHLAAMYIGR